MSVTQTAKVALSAPDRFFFFGGFKQSGIGREGGRDSLLPYLEAKTIILDEEPSHTDS